MKVGDYIRTKKGYIRKIIPSFFDKDMVFVETHTWFKKKDIIKSSPNIIDLIEVGDYVNGHRVDFTNISNKLPYEDKCIGFYDGDGDIILFENDIESILTKEQFKAMEYKCE